MVVYRQDRRRRLTLVLLVITSLALISLDERGSGIIDSARTAAQDVVSPLQTLADDVINPVADWFDGLGRANELQAENEQLRRQLADARSEVAAAKGSAAQPRPSSQQIARPPRASPTPTGVTAEVVAQGAGNFTRTFQISKGSDSGHREGHARSWSATQERRRARRSGRVGVEDARRRASASTTRNFGVGAQLVQGDGFAARRAPPTGQPDSNLLRFSVIVDSATGAVAEGATSQ